MKHPYQTVRIYVTPRSTSWSYTSERCAWTRRADTSGPPTTTRATGLVGSETKYVDGKAIRIDMERAVTDVASSALVISRAMQLLDEPSSSPPSYWCVANSNMSPAAAAAITDHHNIGRWKARRLKMHSDTMECIFVQLYQAIFYTVHQKRRPFCYAYL